MLFRKCLQYLRKYYRKLGIPHHPKRHSSTSLARCWESDVKRQILRYTNLTRKHLTPEIPLFLITKKSPLWFATPEDCPFSDPFWAFYWPGGQALTRYILDNPEQFRGHYVLDVGSGCGASAIACSRVGARTVVANDINKEAVVAIKLNCQENIGSIRTDCSNLIGVQNPEWSTIILGDMFYDETFSNEIIDWLSTHYRLHETNIFIGDPGRIPLLNHPIRHNLVKVAEYKLLKNCIEENHGCTVGVVWKYEPRL